MGSVHPLGYYSATRKEILVSATVWVNPKIILSIVMDFQKLLGDKDLNPL